MNIVERVRLYFGSTVQRQMFWLVGTMGGASAMIFVVFSSSVVELAAGLLTSLFLTTVTMLIASSMVVRPLRRLDETATAIAGGEMGRSADENVPNELGALAASMNMLAGQLRNAHRIAAESKNTLAALAETRSTLSEVQLSYDHLLLVSELGQNIASSLNLEDIITKLYDKINSMMDGAIFALGEYDEEAGEIRFRLAIERSQRIPPYSISMQSKNSFAVWCVNNGKEVFLNNIQRDYARYVDQITPTQSGIEGHPNSLIFLPMFAKQRCIGVICVQSFRENAYTNYHVDMLKSLALYTGAALDNANAYDELGKALQHLRSAQQQLVQSEKMSSLGLLTAGIAHEINNPINFVSANISPLRRDIQEVVQILRRYEALDPAGDIKTELDKVRVAARDLDLNYTMEEIGKLLQGIEEGANRTAEIVRGLRNFSRLDENEFKIADVHEGLDSTLMLLRNKYRDRIEIEKHYGELPKIDCFPGQLNQVFMNILSNAVQAIPDRGTIRVSTEATGDVVRVRIADSGTGMSEEVKKKIFDPFFTTKDVGIGTGLGLAISFGIIEKHNGGIEVESKPGKGTEFIITLPVHQPKSAKE